MKKAQHKSHADKSIRADGEDAMPLTKELTLSAGSEKVKTADKQGGQDFHKRSLMGSASPCQPLSDKLRSFLEEYIDNENDNDNYLLEKDIREAIRRLQEFVNGRNAEDWNGESKICCCDICQIAREIKNIFGTLADEVGE